MYLHHRGPKLQLLYFTYLINLLNILFYRETVDKFFIVLNTYNKYNVNSYLCKDCCPEPRIADFTDLHDQCTGLCTVLDLLSLFLTLLF